MRPPISLGDALVALAELAPRDEVTRDDVLRQLGLAVPRAAAATEVAGRSVPLPPPPTPAASGLAGAAGTVLPPPNPPAAGRPAPLPATLVPSGTTTAVRPSWLPSGGETLAPASVAVAAVAPPPILAPLQARGIYTAALATWVREGDPDIEAAVRERSAGRPLRAIPRAPLRTLRRGVQVLLDVGPSMAPYAADVRHLDASLAALFGDGQIERLFFARCPTRLVRAGPRATRRPWRAPSRGVPLLVVSDFGIAGPGHDDDAAPPAEWRRFADDVRAEGHRVVGLVPFASARWPPPVATAVTLVHWSEQTIAAAVHRAVREAQRHAR